MNTEFTDIEISVPWGQLSCRWYGNRKTRPLLALHGWMDNLGTFERIIPLLPAHLGVLCIDLPGHGCSSFYPDGIQYSFYEWISIIHRVILHFNWPSVSLMGHSMGAMLCNMFAALFPQKVDMIIAIDCISVTFKSPDFFIKYFASSVENMLKPQRPTKLYKNEELHNIRWRPAPAVSSEHAKPLVSRCIESSPEEPDKFSLRRDARSVHFHHIPLGSGFLLRINRRIQNIPYLIIKASDSDHINDKSIVMLSMLCKQNPAFEFYEVPGPHHVHITNPERVAAIIVPFLNKHKPVGQLDAELPASKACKL